MHVESIGHLRSSMYWPPTHCAEPLVARHWRESPEQTGARSPAGAEKSLLPLEPPSARGPSPLSPPPPTPPPPSSARKLGLRTVHDARNKAPTVHFMEAT